MNNDNWLKAAQDVYSTLDFQSKSAHATDKMMMWTIMEALMLLLEDRMTAKRDEEFEKAKARAKR